MTIIITVLNILNNLGSWEAQNFVNSARISSEPTIPSFFAKRILRTSLDEFPFNGIGVRYVRISPNVTNF